ncbi:MAG: hypothetical protein QW270_07320 [Candidatus Bathyarchaeia archaeon]
MMRTVEVMLVIIIILGAFVLASFFAVLPSPREVSPLNLRRLALSTLEVLDSDYSLSEIAFVNSNDTDFAEVVSRLRVALSACLPPNIIYNLTVYQVLGGGGSELYAYCWSVSNAESLGVGSDAASLLVASSNVTFSVKAEKVGERSGVGGTLYILNCSDARGWWITGYSAHSLAQDLYNLLSPYFQKTIMVQNTTDLGKLLNGTKISGSPYENVTNAVIINTFGEAVPIPAGYYATIGYNSTDRSYANYTYTLGLRVNQFNWTWVSIVGYPFYYVTNTETKPFNETHNTWGIYGVRIIGTDGTGGGPSGLNAFLRGLDRQRYSYDASSITRNPGVVYLSPEAMYSCNYYGIYPSPYQTSTRALPDSILRDYHLPESHVTYIFNKVGSDIPGAVFRHVAAGDNKITGSFFALGLTRTPDIRLTALGLLCAFKPRLYRSEYTATNATRLVVLQLGQLGGV